MKNSFIFLTILYIIGKKKQNFNKNNANNDTQKEKTDLNQSDTHVLFSHPNFFVTFHKINTPPLVLADFS